MGDDRQFLYSLAAGAVISILLFWLAFWHGRILLAAAWGLTVSVLCWFRYGGAREWERLQHHGTRRQVRHYQAVVLIVILLFVALAVIAEMQGVLPK